MTTYVVLCKNGSGWIEVATVDASSPVQAVERKATGAGTYVAIAEAHIVDVEPVTQLKATTRKRRSVREVAA